MEVSGPRHNLPARDGAASAAHRAGGGDQCAEARGASRIWVKLHTEARKIYLRIKDNGRGFDQQDVFSSLGGHFGLIGMRERAERLGGELRLESHPGRRNGSGSDGAVAMSEYEFESWLRKITWWRAWA